MLQPAKLLLFAVLAASLSQMALSCILIITIMKLTPIIIGGYAPIAALLLTKASIMHTATSQLSVQLAVLTIWATILITNITAVMSMTLISTGMYVPTAALPLRSKHTLHIAISLPSVQHAVLTTPATMFGIDIDIIIMSMTLNSTGMYVSVAAFLLAKASIMHIAISQPSVQPVVLTTPVTILITSIMAVMNMMLNNIGKYAPVAAPLLTELLIMLIATSQLFAQNAVLTIPAVVFSTSIMTTMDMILMGIGVYVVTATLLPPKRITLCSVKTHLFAGYVAAITQTALFSIIIITIMNLMPTIIGNSVSIAVPLPIKNSTMRLVKILPFVNTVAAVIREALFILVAAHMKDSIPSIIGAYVLIAALLCTNPCTLPPAKTLLFA